MEFAHHIGGRVLDVGSGKHNRYQELFDCDEYIRMDVVEGEDVDVVGSADSIPFNNESFDSVVSTQVFEHLKFPERAVKEIHRVLKRWGCALITVPQYNELHEEPYDYWRFTKFGICELFERNGFKIIRHAQLGGFFTTNCQMKIRYLIDTLKLHRKPLLGCLAHCFFKIFGTIALTLDRLDKNKANRKHAVGWCIVVQKT
jgi:SAM-dependent methyltransferase